jgi:hypothetical protein
MYWLTHNLLLSLSIGGWGYMFTTTVLQEVANTTSFIEKLVGYGIGGVIAALVLLWKRQDDQRYGETLTNIIERLEAREERVLVLVDGINRAQSSLLTFITDISSKSVKEIIEKVEKERGRG